MPNKSILHISIIVTIILIFFSFECLKIKDALTITVLSLTALTLVWTTLDARKNAIEIQIANFRPVVLRDGVIPSWSDFKKEIEINKTQVTFFIANNITTNVTGYLIANGKKYDFSFAITKFDDDSKKYIGNISKESTVTWSLSNKPIIGMLYPDRFSHSNEAEGLYLCYSDIEGNKYETFENPNFQTISRRL